MADTLKPGTYEIEITLRQTAVINDDDEVTELDLISQCRQSGERVDWNVERQEP